jgi:hypothetical protein
MSDQEPRPEDKSPSDKGGEPSRHQQVQVPGVTARVPSSLGHGVISTGAVVMNGPHVFVLDFLQQMGVPSHLVRRVVLPHAVVPLFIQALEQNLANYEQKFGAPMKLPRPANPAQPPSIEEIYDNIKVNDEELPGHFAEGVMIRHSGAEFCFDFVTQFLPNAAVSSRVFLSAPHVLPLLEALKGNYQRLLRNQTRPGSESHDGHSGAGDAAEPPPDPVA